MVPLLGTEFVPKADFSETAINFYTPVGSSLEVTEAKARQVEAMLREIARGALHASPPSTPATRRARSTRAIYVRLVDRKDSARAASTRCRACCASGCARCPASPSRTSACSTAVGGNKQVRVLAAGPRPEGARAAVAAGHARRSAPSRAWSTSTPALKPDKPTVDDRRQARRRLRPRPVGRQQIASSLRTLVAGRPWATGARPTTRPTTSTCAWRPSPQRDRSDLERLPFTVGANADGIAAHRAAERRWPT